ncbi:MAG TPA: hypothetical protein ENN97_02490 [Phycisphaerales bacterium]|nr:hypothetical protein [Phycisphaerales bacterium]
MNSLDVRQLYNLITASVEGDITPEQFMQLKELLCTHPQAVRYYVDYISILCHIRSSDSVDQMTDSDAFDEAFWELLLQHENTAPAIDLPRSCTPPEPAIVSSADRPTGQRRISKSSIISLIVSTAAILFLVLFARFAPPKSGISVATLKDSLNAKWADPPQSMRHGTRLQTGSEMLLLREGLATLAFDNDATVVLEGPAEFQILTSDQINLNYGRIYAIIPPQAYGFLVNTPTAKIIDLGTEFGVQQDMHGNTELHVVRGKTSLVSGVRGSRINVYVEAGDAKRLDARVGQLEDIVCDATLFARHIDSDTQFVWRGQNKLDLADIVGGGNGFGTGQLDTGINPTSSRPASVLLETQSAPNDFRPVLFNPYIDGVFIPDGRTPQIISTEGHLFEACPPTSGHCFNNVLNAVRLYDFQAFRGMPQPSGPSAFKCLLLHANIGVTYDLQALRALLPDANFVRFVSRFGIEKEAMRPALSNADFWILVDGRLQYKKTQVGWGEFYDIELPLSEQNRFLTLVVTDGQDPNERFYENRDYPPIDSDWGMFVDPVLILESK